MRLAFRSYLDTIAEEADRLEGHLGANLQRRVRALPDLLLSDLLGRVAEGYLRWSEQLEAGSERRRPSERKPASPEDLTAGADRLVAALEAAGEEGVCWNPSGEEQTAGWVARHVALSSTVHRVDAEQCSGRHHRVETELAIDGIDERLSVYLEPAAPAGGLGGSLCVVCDDAPAAWVVGDDHGSLRWRHGRGPADAAMVGCSSDVFLFTWNRVTPESFALTGDRDVIRAWPRLAIAPVDD